jgi:uncharacterized membrane protein YkvA (DUF1232 family)
MTFRLTSLLARPWLIRALVTDLRLAVRLMREPLVPIFMKAVPVLAGLYLISPIDVVPDFLPVLGQLDDLALLLLAVKTFVKVVPSATALFHKQALAQGRPYSPMAPGDFVIDADFRRS